MRNVLVIFEREFIAYFNGALAYIIIPVFLMMVGAFSLYFSTACQNIARFLNALLG